MDRLILAIDVGSSSIRCSAFRVVLVNDTDKKDERPTVQSVEGCSTSQKLQAVQPNTGKINVCSEDGRSIFDIIDGCVDNALAKIRERYKIEGRRFVVSAVAFSTFVMNLIGVDEKGRAVDNQATVSYACNTPEVAEECERLRAELGPAGLADMYQRTGAPLHSAYALPQLRVFYATQAELAEKVYKWTTLASICIDRWTNGLLMGCGHVISYSEASWTGLFDFCRGVWDDESKRFLPDQCMLAIPSESDIGSGQVMGITAGSSYWDRWPELQGNDGRAQHTEHCHLLLGIGDGACANIGSKCTTDGRIAVTIGTSAAARIILPLPLESNDFDIQTRCITVASGLFCYRVDAHHVLVGGALTDGGSVIEWLRAVFNIESDDAFLGVMTRLESKYKAKNSDDASRLAAVPFLSGERSTGFRAGATGVLTGITRETTSDDIILSFLEGVVLRLNAVLTLITDTRRSSSDAAAAGGIPGIIASGNGLVKNPLWMQMLADCSGMKVFVDDETSEATSRGAALMAALSLKAEITDGSHADHSAEIGTLGEEEIITRNRTEPGSIASVPFWSGRTISQDRVIDAMSPTWKC